MSIFKCKMCGGTIEFEQGATVGVCDSCGTKQTLPRQDDGKKAASYEEAIGIFKTISGRKDADEQIYACQKKIEEIKVKEEAEEKAAQKRKKAFAIGTPIVCACIAFLIVLTTAIIPNNKYNAAVALMEAGQYEDAITAFEMLMGYKDSAEQIIECNYLRALELMDAGKYSEAIAAFKELNGYKDSEEQIINCKNEIILKSSQVGDTVYFGAYEQDNNTSNGKEAIEWTVLDKDGTSLLLVSKQALDCQQYNTSYTDVTWEKCPLRKWMNGTFLNNAFSAEEQAQIQNTNVSADKNPKNNSTNPGNATTDKVFLLSIAEAEKYFTTDESRKCAPTAYAKSQGAWTSDSDKTASGEATCWWWLRSPGYVQSLAAGVLHGGSVYYYGDRVNYDKHAVRPALWINLDS